MDGKMDPELAKEPEQKTPNVRIFAFFLFFCSLIMRNSPRAAM